MKQVFIALGTNIEPREEHLNKALALLAEDEAIIIKRKSSIYETAPMGYVDQSHFLNMVIKIETYLSPTRLLDTCQSIERELGRVRIIRNGPRTIDLDILVYNKENIQTDRLTIPHPRMNERAFVLIPLVEIASNLTIPIRDKLIHIQDLVNDLPDVDKAGVLKWSSEGVE